jgi:hypothetical protein
MTAQELKAAIFELAQRFDQRYKIRWANAKATKPAPPCMVLNLKSVTASTHPVVSIENGAVVKSHPSTALLEVNLYTPGKPVAVSSGLVPYENTACDELTAFCNFLEYPDTENFQISRDVSVLPRGAVLDVTAILDNMEPEYRAMAEFSVDFVQSTEDPYARSGKDGVGATGYFETVEINESEGL